MNKKIVKFGKYFQETGSNQKQDIEWYMLDKKDDKYLLVSCYALDVMPYHDKVENVDWQACSLRKWLVDNFFMAAFTEEEREKICCITLLNIDEAKEYFDCDSDRVCEPTEYALSEDGNIVRSTGAGCWCWWWLRSPGSDSSRAAYVGPSGSIIDIGCLVNFSSIAVRPAIWVDPDVVDGSAEISYDFDPVSRPRHYADGNIECIDAMEDVFGVEAVKHFCLCNAFKYHWRHDKKGGNEDIEKATWYMDKYRELVNR